MLQCQFIAKVKTLEPLKCIFALSLVNSRVYVDIKKSFNDLTLKIKVQGTNNQSVKKGPFILWKSDDCAENILPTLAINEKLEMILKVSTELLICSDFPLFFLFNIN